MPLLVALRLALGGFLPLQDVLYGSNRESRGQSALFSRACHVMSVIRVKKCTLTPVPTTMPWRGYPEDAIALTSAPSPMLGGIMLVAGFVDVERMAVTHRKVLARMGESKLHLSRRCGSHFSPSLYTPRGSDGYREKAR